MKRGDAYIALVNELERGPAQADPQSYRST